MQITAIRGARAYLGDKLIRTAKPDKLLDPDAGPLIAVRLNILTRKTLGGLQTDLNSRVLARRAFASAIATPHLCEPRVAANVPGIVG